jgi:sulfate permease, SulP family
MHYRNVLGAFSDCAILLPILGLLSSLHGFSESVLLVTAGFAYITTGILFKIPTPVQPLKSIAISAAALGATQAEIRLSGAALGFVCVFLAFTPVNRLMKQIPVHIIHGLQFSLGLLLIQKGMESNFIWALPAVLITLGAKFYRRTGLGTPPSIPILGWIAVLGLFWSLSHCLKPNIPTFVSKSMPLSARLPIVFSLLLPQLALTLGNSVFGTVAAANYYFGNSANRVTPRRLLFSIGFGNLISNFFGGLPFCHGSGGLTAHVKGGATSVHSNFIIGSFLVAIGLVTQFSTGLSLKLPTNLSTLLLIIIGIFHLDLAKSTLKDTEGKIQLIIISLPALVSGNLLWSLVAALAIESLLGLLKNSRLKAGDS